jgi:CheY-like chemotaxis protein
MKPPIASHFPEKLTTSAPSFTHGKTILLVDVNTESREKRASTLRKLGVNVHCATSAASAQARFERGTYNLVLLDFGKDNTRSQALADEIHAQKPRQMVAFLVGSPMFVSHTLNGVPKKSKATADIVSDASGSVDAKEPEPTDFGREVKQAESELNNLEKDLNA